MPPKPTQYAFATGSCSTVTEDGIPVSMNAGDIWDASDPFVKSHPALFSTTPPLVRRTTAERVIEQATAAPGEKRTTNRG